MPENPTTALVKTSQSPTLARVSNQLALTDKLLTRPEDKEDLISKREASSSKENLKRKWPTVEEYNNLPELEQKKLTLEIREYNRNLEEKNATTEEKNAIMRVENYFKLLANMPGLEQHAHNLNNSKKEYATKLKEQILRLKENLLRMHRQILSDPLTKKVYEQTIRSIEKK